ncbi:MAG: helix-turn-helix domain-containing protein, partial [Chromatiales bacterium]|nr:helix-turn-helix domain-containing protein [Chromatiales bacterium]
MARRARLHYTKELKSEIWDKYKRGDSLWSIARSIDRHSSCIYGILSRTGGIRPPERKRSSLALSLSEREEISRGIVSQLSIRTIASQLGRSASTVCREINRNGGLRRYRANQAEQAAWDRAYRPKTCKLATTPKLIPIIEKKLRIHWSPEQISGWLKMTYPHDENFQVSHETIY